tara:strand:- start:5508 stop:5753 length:246 start_codon:yes stop_codon:yes gene_type:complete
MVNPVIESCSLCYGIIDTEDNGWTEGHNAEPISDGRCCTKCNDELVMPARITLLRLPEDVHDDFHRVMQLIIDKKRNGNNG